MELIRTIDENFLQLLYSVRLPFLNNFFVFITNLGSFYFVSLISVLFILFLISKRENRVMIAYVVTLATTYGSVYLLKMGFGRMRPLEEIAYIIEKSYSFPSAHAAIAVAYIGFFLFYLKQRQSLRKTTMVIGLVLMTLIGLSRIYLGVHYLSDVIGGIAIGFFWLYIIRKFVWHRRG
jgi:membrane-associated phospholipid phosphatase